MERGADDLASVISAPHMSSGLLLNAARSSAKTGKGLRLLCRGDLRPRLYCSAFTSYGSGAGTPGRRALGGQMRDHRDNPAEVQGTHPSEPSRPDYLENSVEASIMDNVLTGSICTDMLNLYGESNVGKSDYSRRTFPAAPAAAQELDTRRRPPAAQA